MVLSAMQENLNRLVAEIQDERSENTKLGESQLSRQ